MSNERRTKFKRSKIMNKKIIISIIFVIIILIGIISSVLFNKLNMKNNSNIEYEATKDELSNNIISNSNIEVKNNNKIINNSSEIENIDSNPVKNETISSNTSNLVQEQITQTKKESMDMIKIKVNNNVLEVNLEDNEATKSLVERLKNGDISVNTNEYGGFEKVGNLGFSLPRNDKNITTSAGDIVLYQGNQISLFYNSNSWSYTKLGRVQNISSRELKDILGSGNVTLVISLD